MANLAGKTALVVSEHGVAAGLAGAICAELRESAATVLDVEAGMLPRRITALAAGGGMNLLVGGLETLVGCADDVAAMLSPRGLVIGLAGPTARLIDLRALAGVLKPVTVLALRPSTARVTGRCVAALAMDPDIAEKAGGLYAVSRLGQEYRFTDPDMPDATSRP